MRFCDDDDIFFSLCLSYVIAAVSGRLGDRRLITHLKHILPPIARTTPQGLSFMNAGYESCGDLYTPLAAAAAQDSESSSSTGAESDTILSDQQLFAIVNGQANKDERSTKEGGCTCLLAGDLAALLITFAYGMV